MFGSTIAYILTQAAKARGPISHSDSTLLPLEDHHAGTEAHIGTTSDQIPNDSQRFAARNGALSCAIGIRTSGARSTRSRASARALGNSEVRRLISN